MSNFRSIDVDAFDEDAYTEETIENGKTQADIAALRKDIRQLIQKSNYQSAFDKVFTPIVVADEKAKDELLATVMETLAAVKPSEAAALLKSFSIESIDMLMKFVYKGMARPETYRDSNLLVWHERAFEIGGHGSIVRVLTDRSM